MNPFFNKQQKVSDENRKNQNFPFNFFPLISPYFFSKHKTPCLLTFWSLFWPMDLLQNYRTPEIQYTTLLSKNNILCNIFDVKNPLLEFVCVHNSLDNFLNYLLKKERATPLGWGGDTNLLARLKYYHHRTLGSVNFELWKSLLAKVLL